MKNIFQLSILIIIASHSITSFSQTKVNVSFYPKEDAPQISKHIYGHFAEHLGRCIYGGCYVGEDSEIPI